MVYVKTWMEISGERLAGNYLALRRIVSGPQDSEGNPTSLLAVVKANAYGHGIDPCAAFLASAGADWLGVTDAQEGLRVRAALRAAGWADERHPQILVMCGTVGLAGEAEYIVRNRLTAVVWDTNHIVRLAEAARALGMEEPVRVHLEVDSGMTRQGVLPGPDLGAVLKALASESRIVLDGVFTHFASTEVVGSPQTAAQKLQFEAAIDQVGASGLNPLWVHVGNSSYIDNDGGSSVVWVRALARLLGARPMVRSGLALYGYLLPLDGTGSSQALHDVRPVMTWKTRVIGLRHVRPWALVGYNGTFAAESPMELALLPVGYADGLRRELSSTNSKDGGCVMIGGQRAPIVGRVSMNLTTVDVTGLLVAEGDEVVLLGDGFNAQDHARLSGTIPYEILCGVKSSSVS